MADTGPPDDLLVICILGPYTLRCCVTAACTRCGAAPLDEDTGIAPHFDSPDQATTELTRDWGWHLAAWSDRMDDIELLCPACAPTDDPEPPDPRLELEPPSPEDPGQPRLEMPPNAAVIPTTQMRPAGRPCPG